MPNAASMVLDIPASENPYALEILRCCKRLRISPNLARKFIELGSPESQAFFAHLLVEEVKARDTVRLNKILKAASFPRRYSFEQFDPSEIQFPETITFEGVKRLEFFLSENKEKDNIVMYGRTGTGKTMLSICIGIEACKRKIPVMFIRTAALANLLTEGLENKRLNSVITKLKAASIFILDEFGYVPYSRSGSQLLFDFLSDINEDSEKSVIVTTNLEFSSWAHVLYDERMAEAFVGRLMHHCHLLVFPGENRRLQESNAFKASMKK